MGKINIVQSFRGIFTKRFRSETFIVLDIGTFSVKALYISGEEVKKFSKRRYRGGDVMGGGINKEGVLNACRFVLGELKRSISGRGRFTNKVILGMGGGFVYGKTLTQSYIRDNPGEEISEGEFSNIIQKVQQRNYEQIRRDFKKETGRSELDLHLLSGALQDIRIDGYQVVNPIGFKGREVSCGLFNSYTPKEHLELFEDIIHSLRLELVSIVSGPYSVFSSFYAHNTSDTDFILIDIGGSTTEISLIRKGRLDDVKSISIGGASFTRSISENLKIGLWEAENIKRSFSQGKASEGVLKKIEGIINADVKLFFRGLEMVLSELSQTTLLPSKIYVYGGGSKIPMIAKIFSQARWRDSLSFSSKPIAVILSPSGIGYSPDVLGEDVSWTVPLSLASTYIKEEKQSDDITKAVKRSLRLIRN